jgi:4-alpha-glucanotransferase
LAYGITANLYTLRSTRNWGVGDLTDLATLGRWAARRGAAFVAINPLHALLNRNGALSPYSPVSRLFRNPLYLDPVAVPGFAECAEARAWLRGGGMAADVQRMREGDRVDYAAVMALKRPLLEVLHRRAAPREPAYARYVAEQGEALMAFATYLALAERFGPEWRTWPAELRRPGGAAAAAFRREHAAAIDFHCWVQYEIDRQLGRAAAAAGLELGLVGDLAIGTAPNGADTWAAPDLFVAGASLGAPPDPHSPGGQDWGLAPLDPRALAARRFDYWILLLRAALRHMGGLRLDHVMGLFRQFWIPPGGRPADGAYVRYPAEPLLAILALESTRAGAVIVGEDLGTVPRGLPAVLRRWGILSTRVLYFEREGAGFKPARRYSNRALATVNTHDHAPLAGYWCARDIELGHAVGAIPSAGALATARRVRARERRALLRRLAAERVLPDAQAPASSAALAAAVHSFLAGTPAPLIGLSLDDLMGETEPVNLPGIGLDRYPSWQRRSALPLERLTTAAEVRRALGDQRRRVRPGTWRDS